MEKKFEYLSKMRLSAIYRLRQLHRRTRVINHKPVHIVKNFHVPHYGPANTDSSKIEFSNFEVGRGAKVAYIYN